MEIKAEIKRFITNKPTKAFADVVIDDAFVVHGIGVIEKDGDMFISMPRNTWKNKLGEEKSGDVCHPISSLARKQIQDAVVASYEKAKATQGM